MSGFEDWPELPDLDPERVLRGSPELRAQLRQMLRDAAAGDPESEALLARVIGADASPEQDTAGGGPKSPWGPPDDPDDEAPPGVEYPGR